MTPTQEDHETAARLIVEKWEDSFGICPHYPKTRCSECGVCLEGLIAAALSEAVRLAIEARDKEWCYAHGWREGAFDADGKPFSPERHAAIMQEAIKTAGEGVEEAVRVAVEGEREAWLAMFNVETEGLMEPSLNFTMAKLGLRDLVREVRAADAQATPAPERPRHVFECGRCKNCGVSDERHGPEGFCFGALPLNHLRGTPPETGEKEPGR